MSLRAFIADHPLADLVRARFDNADVAAALDLPTFPDWRKNLERLSAFALPREDKNPARPRYRYAHVVEYALNSAVGQVTTKAAAARVVAFRLRLLSDEAAENFHNLSPEDQELLFAAGLPLPTDNLTYKEVERWKLDLLARVPLLSTGMGLFRREEGKSALLLVAPEIADSEEGTEYRLHYQTREAISVEEGLRLLSNVRWRGNSGSYGEPNYRAAGIIDVAGVLRDLDKRLRTRLAARLIVGEDD